MSLHFSNWTLVPLTGKLQMIAQPKDRLAMLTSAMIEYIPNLGDKCQEPAPEPKNNSPDECISLCSSRRIIAYNTAVFFTKCAFHIFVYVMILSLSDASSVSGPVNLVLSLIELSNIVGDRRSRRTQQLGN